MGRIFYGIQAQTGYTIRYGQDPGSKINIIGNANISMLGQYDDYLAIHLIRDPRDIVISGYFSHRNSHPVNKWPAMARLRDKLNEVEIDEGLFHEMDFLVSIFNDLITWDYDNPRVLELKFEDITLEPDLDRLFRFLQVSCDNGLNDHVRFHFLRLLNKVSNRGVLPFSNTEVKVPMNRSNRVVEDNSFVKMSGGRTKGTADAGSHYRKGVSGDWKKHFTEKHRQHFKSMFPDILNRLGYDAGDGW